MPAHLTTKSNNNDTLITVISGNKIASFAKYSEENFTNTTVIIDTIDIEDEDKEDKNNDITLFVDNYGISVSKLPDNRLIILFTCQ
jgi:hypothetical protein